MVIVIVHIVKLWHVFLYIMSIYTLSHWWDHLHLLSFINKICLKFKIKTNKIKNIIIIIINLLFSKKLLFQKIYKIFLFFYVFLISKNLPPLLFSLDSKTKSKTQKTKYIFNYFFFCARISFFQLDIKTIN